MGYYIRILGTKTDVPSLDSLAEAAAPAVLKRDAAGEADWQQLLLEHPSGAAIALMERNLVLEGELGAEELEEFQDEVAGCKPDSGAAWLRAYLPTVRVIYAMQLLDGTQVDGGWSAVHRVQAALWSTARGILQADGEGFSNEDGFTILWQFSDRAHGKWHMGVLGPDGGWIHFRMDLGDGAQRESFIHGEVPAGAELL